MAERKTKKTSETVGEKKPKKTVKKTVQKTAKKAVKTPEKQKPSIISKTKSRRPKKKTNLLRLCVEMNKVVLDAVDKEVTKRFRTLVDAAEEDITKTGLHSIIRNWKEVDITQYHESLQPYIKHYVFMVKRQAGR